MRVLYVSASQITLFRRCKRRWAVQALAKWREARSKSQATGVDVHALAETYALTGQSVPVGHEHYTKMAAAIPYIRVLPGNLVEWEIGFPVYPGGPWMTGYMDLIEAPTYDALVGWFLAVLDYKTTTDFQYNKTAQELLENVQMMIYAYWAYRMVELPVLFPVPPCEEWRPVWEQGLDLVRAAHLYIKTKNVIRAGKADRVNADASWGRVAKEWVAIVETVKEMEAMAARWPELPADYMLPPEDPTDPDDRGQPRPELLAPRIRLALLEEGNRQDCMAYHRQCYMHENCPESKPDPKATLDDLFDKTQTLETEMSDPSTPGSTMDSLAERLKAKMSGTPTPAAKPAAAPPAPAQTDLEKRLAASVAANAAKGAAKPAAAPAPAAAKPTPTKAVLDVGPEGQAECNGRRWWKMASVGGFIQCSPEHACPKCAPMAAGPAIVPSDAPAPVDTPEDQPAPAVEEDAPDEGGAPAAEMGATAPAETPTPATQPAPAAPRKRGRPPKAAASPAPATQAPAPAASTPEPAAPQEAAQAAPEPAAEVTHPDQRPTAEQLAADAGPAATIVPRPAAWLYINASPETGMHTPHVRDWAVWMDAILVQLHAQLTKAYGKKIHHYKMEEYGKGPGTLAAFITANWDNCPEVCVVDTFHPEASVFLGVACSRAANIIRGRQ